MAPKRKPGTKAKPSSKKAKPDTSAAIEKLLVYPNQDGKTFQGLRAVGVPTSMIQGADKRDRVPALDLALCYSHSSSEVV